MAADAKRMPAREAEYKNLVLNQRVEVNNPFVSQRVWNACGTPVAPLEGVESLRWARSLRDHGLDCA